ncbi:MAG: glycosyltransferase family 2 protein [Oscillatoriales cyanobacterium C42_A2020_001]|nr:glycosyltransferase family 2 protein [Leptolyngbyaceae cyanobacterium C42_A2020_001]
MAHTPTFELGELPSFSIIVETENLSSSELEGLSASLNSIAAQDIPPTAANEVLILESGDVPAEMIQRLCQDYPWLTVRSIPANLDYYAAKMKGVALATGEVIVLADSDCVYEPNWLRSLLQPFADATVQAIAGETRTSSKGTYGLAISLTYIFPPFSQKNTLQPTRFYFCNNAAFRRLFLLKHPIPTDLPIYRGNCVIHAHTLTQQGITLWRQPAARATHAAPNGISHFLWRFLLLGYDTLLIYRLKRSPGNTEPVVKPVLDLGISLAIALFRVKQVIQRLVILILEHPLRLLNLPVALVVALASLLLFTVGLIISYVRPTCFLSPTGRVEVDWENS